MACMCVCVFACMHMYVCVCVCVCMHACVCIIPTTSTTHHHHHHTTHLCCMPLTSGLVKLLKLKSTYIDGVVPFVHNGVLKPRWWVWPCGRGKSHQINTSVTVRCACLCSYMSSSLSHLSPTPLHSIPFPPLTPPPAPTPALQATHGDCHGPTSLLLSCE